jgi:hypothetical protein
LLLLSHSPAYCPSGGAVATVTHSFPHTVLREVWTITYLLTQALSTIVSVGGGSDRSPAQRPLLVTVKTVSIRKPFCLQYLSQNVKAFQYRTSPTVTCSRTITYLLPYSGRVSTIVSASGGSDCSPAQRPLLVTLKGFLYWNLFYSNSRKL